MADQTVETPIWGDELQDFMTLGTDSALEFIEVTNLLSWEFDGDSTTYEPEYINRRLSPIFTLAEKVAINYEKDLYRNNDLDAFLASHEDDTDIPVRICRVRTWETVAGGYSAKAAIFLLTPNQLDKNTAGEPVKLKGSLSMSDAAWTKGVFDPKTKKFTPEGEKPAASDAGGGQSEVQKALDDMTVDELKTYAATHSIDIAGKTSKADILAAIKAAEAVPGGN